MSVCWGSVLTNEDPFICLPDGSSSTVQDVFLSRLLQTGATESSSTNHFANEMEEHREITTEKAKSILNNLVTTINNIWCLKDGLHTALLKKLPGDGKPSACCLMWLILSVSQLTWLHFPFVVSCGQKLSNDLEVEVKKLRSTLSELHLKHKSLASEFRIKRDIDAKNKAELRRLKGKFSLVILKI